jgi:hypothetical protein
MASYSKTEDASIVSPHREISGKLSPFGKNCRSKTPLPVTQDDPYENEYPRKILWHISWHV